MTQPDRLSLVRPRRAWLAALMSLVIPHVGYLYLGRPRRALIAATLIFGPFFIIWHGLWGFLAQPWITVTFGCFGILAYVFFLIDSVRIALQSRAYELRGYNRWWVYVGAAALILIIGLPLNERTLRTFSVPTNSMQPALRPGDRFVVDMHAFSRRSPDRGDVVVFSMPNLQHEYVRRVIGLPGDRIEILGGTLTINGMTVAREPSESCGETEAGPPAKERKCFQESIEGAAAYQTLDTEAHSPADGLSTYAVPAGYYFLLGDNRREAQDSRDQTIGFVPIDNILGKATGIFWSPTLTRIGKRLD